MENIDCMTGEELRAFYDKPSVTLARELFPNRQKGYVRVTKDCQAYAINKCIAMQCRTEGRIAIAQNYERICDDIYNTLPAFAQW